MYEDAAQQEIEQHTVVSLRVTFPTHAVTNDPTNSVGWSPMYIFAVASNGSAGVLGSMAPSSDMSGKQGKFVCVN